MTEKENEESVEISMASTALSNDLLIFNLSFFKDLISVSIASFAISLKFIFFISETKYLL